MVTTAAGRHRQARDWRRGLGQAAVVGSTLLATATILVPVVWMFSAAVRPIRELLTYPPKLIPGMVTADYFLRILRHAKYQRFFANSVALSLTSLGVTLVLAALASGPFASSWASRLRHDPGAVWTKNSVRPRKTVGSAPATDQVVVHSAPRTTAGLRRMRTRSVLPLPPSSIW